VRRRQRPFQRQCIHFFQIPLLLHVHLGSKRAQVAKAPMANASNTSMLRADY
jgi:hypothetical protein